MLPNQQPVVEYADFRLSKFQEVKQMLNDRATFYNCCHCIAKAWKIYKTQNIDLNEALQISINDFFNQEFEMNVDQINL